MLASFLLNHFAVCTAPACSMRHCARNPTNGFERCIIAATEGASCLRSEHASVRTDCVCRIGGSWQANMPGMGDKYAVWVCLCYSASFASFTSIAAPTATAATAAPVHPLYAELRSTLRIVPQRCIFKFPSPRFDLNPSLDMFLRVTRTCMLPTWRPCAAAINGESQQLTAPPHTSCTVSTSHSQHRVIWNMLSSSHCCKALGFHFAYSTSMCSNDSLSTRGEQLAVTCGVVQ